MKSQRAEKHRVFDARSIAVSRILSLWVIVCKEARDCEQRR